MAGTSGDRIVFSRWPAISSPYMGRPEQFKPPWGHEELVRKSQVIESSTTHPHNMKEKSALFTTAIAFSQAMTNNPGL